MIDGADPEAWRPICDDCGRRLWTQDECEQCYGEDPYGGAWFCPDCDFCCGC